jgi:hypothetical protein
MGRRIRMRTIDDLLDAEWTDAAAVGEDEIAMPITTTLYDLIATIREVVGPGDDNLVVATTVHMLGSRWVTFSGNAQASRRFVEVELSGDAGQQDTLDIA